VPSAEFTDSETEIRCVDLDPTGNLAVSGSDDGNDKQFHPPPTLFYFILYDIFIFIIIYFCIKGNIAFYDLRSQTHIRTTQPHVEAITRVKFTPDGGRVITCSEDHHIKVKSRI
jgi:WD40 repeat protein